jgi:hypothetical protein
MEQVPHTDFPEESVLGGDVTAAEYYEITVSDHTVGFVYGGAVQNLITAEGNPGFGKGCGGNGGKLTGTGVIFGIGTDKYNAGIPGQTAPDPVDKTVGIA